MSKQSYWRSHSIKIITQVIESAFPDADLTKLIDAAYPFGDRKNLPYKLWLEERKKALIRLSLYTVPSNRVCKYHPNGQTCLICQFLK